MWLQHRRRIENRVRIPDGTATVCVEVLHLAKASHWGNLRRLCRIEDTQVRRTAQMWESTRFCKYGTCGFLLRKNGCGDSVCRVAAAFFCRTAGRAPDPPCMDSPGGAGRSPTEYCLLVWQGDPVRIRNNRPLLC